jgi:predicted adenine nucleotide alpha hydrolase (AANH) superfamily ATPase/very-short-patch-repair endonuclease
MQLKEMCSAADCLTPLAGGVPAKPGRGGHRSTTFAKAFAKVLRKKMTMYECLLWKNLQKSPSGFSFRKQHPIGNYIVDFINLEHKLIIELDGNGHLENKQIRHDAIRDKFLVDSGYRIIRFWNLDVYKKMQMVLDTIYYFLTHDSVPKFQNFYPAEIINPLPGFAGTPPASGVRQSDTENTLAISDFIVLFFNPNIYPEIEYQKRLAEQIKFCESVDVKYHVGDYNHDAWLKNVADLEDEPERGARCSACFKYRFKYAQKFAIENGYDAIASVLGVSRHKNQSQVDNCATDVLTEIKYIPVKWQTNQKSAIINQKSFYRQNYCGCEFSTKSVKTSSAVNKLDLAQ